MAETFLQQCERIASHDPAVKREANRLAKRLRAEAKKHYVTGELLEGISVQQRELPNGHLETEVVVEREHFLAIEYGHWAGKGGNRVWVEGIGIVATALRKHRTGA